jgi:hypothetical protein
VHPDYAGNPKIISNWQQAGIAESESARLVDWYCAVYPFRVQRIERDLKFKLRKQGWCV